MNGLQIFNAVVIAAGASLGLVLGVVCVIYLFYIGDTPRLQGQFEALLWLTLGCTMVSAAAALAFHAQRGQRRWRWWVQPLPAVPLAAMAMYLSQLF